VKKRGKDVLLFNRGDDRKRSESKYRVRMGMEGRRSRETGSFWEGCSNV
jgi:hypothetical protein